MTIEKHRNPFVGLRPFDQNESDLFFGRNNEIKVILHNLLKINFTAIVGSSGSGKSSLVKCGIIPKIKNQEVNWNISFCNPGSDPIRNLSKSLIETYSKSKNNTNNYSNTLSQENSNIIDIINKINPNNSGKFLIVIDQFEEIFNFSKTDYKKKCIHFVNLLLNSFKKKENNIYIILTLRSDFIGNCAEFPGLTEALNKSQYLIPRLNISQFKDVINRPLNQFNYTITNSLLNTLLDNILNNQDQLPILQHSIMRTFEYWKANSSHNHPLDIVHYKAIGTMKKALSNHADEAYEELSIEEKKVCEKVFKILINFENLKVTRNPVPFSQLIKITGFKPEILINVINNFRKKERSFLKPIEGVKINENTIIDISHESLFRLWSRLKTWIKEEMESSLKYKNLCEAAELYQQGKGSLLINPELEIILKWRENQKPTEDWGLRYNYSYIRAINFLEHSKKKNEEDIFLKNLKQKNRIKRTRRFNVFISIACVICLFLGIFSWIEKEKANAAIKIANVAKENALNSRKEALASKDTAEIAKKIADIKSIEAEKSKIEAINAKEIAVNAKDEAIKSANKEKIAAKKAKKESIRANKEEKEAIRLKNISTAIKMAFEAEKSFDLKLIDKGIEQAIESFNLYTYNAKKAKLQNQIYSALNRALFEGKNYESRFYKHNIGLKKVEKASSINILALLDNSKTVSIIKENKIGLNKIPNLKFNNINDIAFTNNGKKLVTGSTKGELNIYNVNNLNSPLKKILFNSNINSIQYFYFSGIEYLLISEERNFNIINFSKYERIDVSDLLKIKPSKVLISKNGRYLASYEKDSISIYSIEINNSKISLKLLDIISEGFVKITTLKFLTQNLIATGSRKGEVKVYSISDFGKVSFIKKITNHKDVKISDIDIYENLNETYIVTSSFDNTLNITNLKNSEELITFKDYNGWVTDLYLDKKEKKIYSISQDKFLRYWFIKPDDILNKIKN